jgi:flagellin
MTGGTFMLSLDLGSFFATRLARHSAAVDRSQAKIASGVRLNSSADGPTDLFLADALRAQVEGGRQAQVNIQQSMSILNFAQENVADLFPALNKMRELVLSAGNGDRSDDNRNDIQVELEQLREQLKANFFDARDFRIPLDAPNPADRVLHFQVSGNPGDLVSADFNGLSAAFGEAIVSFYGYESVYNDPAFRPALEAKFGSPPPKPTDPHSTGTSFAQAFPQRLKVNSGDRADIGRALDAVDTVQDSLQRSVSYIGAIANRIDLRLNQTETFTNQMADFESKMRDTDVAFELTKLSTAQVVEQAAQAMLAQANSRPQRILELLSPR